MVDLVFAVEGSVLARDHAYALFGALCRRQPAFHGKDHPVGVFPINGRPVCGQLEISERSCLRLRLPAERIGEGRRLEGARLGLDGARIRLGEGAVEAVRATSSLYSPWVTFNGAGERGLFLQRLEERLGQLEIDPVQHGHLKDVGRRTRSIRGMTVAGFPVILRDLSLAQSDRVCSEGLGGRRHFGGGLFLPASACVSLVRASGSAGESARSRNRV